MRLFLDTNVVIDYLAKRQPFAADACRIMTVSYGQNWELCISSLSFTTIYYVLRKQYAHKELLSLLADINKAFTVLAVDGNIIEQALDSAFLDFEDAVQYYTAKESNADVVITRNVKDYVNSAILVKTPTEFCDLLQGYDVSNHTPSLLNEPAVSYGED